MSTEERLRFWHENELAVRTLVQQAGTSQGFVAVVADSRDPLGLLLASVSAELAGADFDAHVRKTEAKHQIPTAVFLLETASAKRVLELHMPSIAAKLIDLPEGMIFGVIVSGGSSTLIATRVEPLAPAGLLMNTRTTWEPNQAEASIIEAAYVLRADGVFDEDPGDTPRIARMKREIEAALDAANRAAAAFAHEKARLDADGTAKPKTEIVAVMPPCDDPNDKGRTVHVGQATHYIVRPTETAVDSEIHRAIVGAREKFRTIRVMCAEKLPADQQEKRAADIIAICQAQHHALEPFANTTQPRPVAGPGEAKARQVEGATPSVATKTRDEASPRPSQDVIGEWWQTYFPDSEVDAVAVEGLRRMLAAPSSGQTRCTCAHRFGHFSHCAGVSGSGRAERSSELERMAADVDRDGPLPTVLAQAVPRIRMLAAQCDYMFPDGARCWLSARHPRPDHEPESLLRRTARAIDEWHEVDGAVLWWRFPINEPPYAGTPLDDSFPDYVTHWTRIPIPAQTSDELHYGCVNCQAPIASTGLCETCSRADTIGHQRGYAAGVAELKELRRLLEDMTFERDRLRESDRMLMQGLNTKEQERRRHRDALQAWADEYAVVRPNLVAGRLAREDTLWDACMDLGLRVPLMPAKAPTESFNGSRRGRWNSEIKRLRDELTALKADERARARLWAHLVSEHAAIIPLETSMKDLEDTHKHEHKGPGTIRNHDESSRSYSLKKLGAILYESET